MTLADSKSNVSSNNFLEKHLIQKDLKFQHSSVKSTVFCKRILFSQENGQHKIPPTRSGSAVLVFMINVGLVLGFGVVTVSNDLATVSDDFATASNDFPAI